MLNESFVLPLPRNTTRRLCHWPSARDLFVLTLATTRVLENIDDTKEHVKEVKSPIYPPRKWTSDYVIQQHLYRKSLALVRKQQGLRDISWKGDQGNRKLIPAEEGTEGETRVIFSPPLSKVFLVLVPPALSSTLKTWLSFTIFHGGLCPLTGPSRTHASLVDFVAFVAGWSRLWGTCTGVNSPSRRPDTQCTCNKDWLCNCALRWHVGLLQHSWDGWSCSEIAISIQVW